MNNLCVAVIATYNGMQWIDTCLKSLQDHAPDVEIIAVDNASSDDTADYISDTYPNVILHSSDTNLGFGRANNIGIKRALDMGAEYVFLLNQDAKIENNAIQILVEIQQGNPEYGVLSPLHLNRDGDHLDDGFINYAGPQYAPDLLNDLCLNKRNPVYETSFVNAAAWLINRNCLTKVGGFDPIFFHYGEDYNFCERVYYHNMKVGIVPEARICHNRKYKPANNGPDQILRHYLLTMANINNDNFEQEGRRLRRQDIARMASGIRQGNVKKVWSNWNNFLVKRSFRKRIHISRGLNKQGGLNYL